MHKSSQREALYVVIGSLNTVVYSAHNDGSFGEKRPLTHMFEFCICDAYW